MGPWGLEDFAMNTVCAAGTGSSLTSRRAGSACPSKEFGELPAPRHPHIVGRCSVAKSDMIHLQQIATPKRHRG
jgi:activator of 2-hydroxyglutaryl-CoA dehydratase